MSSWSNRRKFLYASIVVIVIVGGIALPLFLYFYRAPTCFDGKKNGNEQGIDCGGSCQKLCQSAFLSPNVVWTRYEQVALGLYNVATYIVNPNTEGEAKNVPYRVVLYDSRAIPITEYTSTVTLPSHRNTLAFRGAVSVGKRIPEKALFEFTSAPNWVKTKDTLGIIQVLDKQYSEEDNNSSLSVTLKNSSVEPIGPITVNVILYDKDGNALGFSKTTIDTIEANGTVVAPFTWPISRYGKVVSIEVLPVKE